MKPYPEETTLTEADIPYFIDILVLADIPALMEIEKVSFPLPWMSSSYEHDVLKNKLAHYLCVRPRTPPAEPGMRPTLLGYTGFWMLCDEAHLSTIAIHPEKRGLGLGEFLLLGAIDEAQRLGACEVTLEVRVSNDVARSLYRKYDFEEVGIRRAYYTDNREDAVIMTTPPLSSPEYGRLLAARRSALYRRLAGHNT